MIMQSWLSLLPQTRLLWHWRGNRELMDYCHAWNLPCLPFGFSRHEGPDIGGEIELSEEQFDRESKKNVERWVSAHIVPVCHNLLAFNFHGVLTGWIKEYPLPFDSNEHVTLLDGKPISFKPVSKVGGHGPKWGRFTLDNGAKIIGKKEASILDDAFATLTNLSE